MKKISEILKEVHKLDAEIFEASKKTQELQADLDKEISDKRNEFNNLKTEINDILARLKVVIENFCFSFKDVVSIDGNYLRVNGKISYLNFDAETCFSVKNKAMADLVGALKTRKSETVCVSYNTLKRISSSTSDLFAAASIKITEQYSEKIAKCNEETEAIRLKQDSLIAEINKALKGVQLSELIIDNSFTVENNYGKDINIPLAYYRIEGAVGKKIKAKDCIADIASWNLQASGILNIETKASNLSSPMLTDIIKNIMLRVMACYPATSKRFLICDKTADKQIVSFAGVISEKAPALFLNSKKSYLTEKSDSDINAALNTVDELIMSRLTLLGRSGYEDMLSYNAENIDNIQPLVFIVMYGYPYGFSQSGSVLQSILKNGKETGVYAIIVSSPTAENGWGSDKAPDISDYTAVSCKFEASGNASYLLFDDQRYIPDTRAENFAINDFLNNFVTVTKIDQNAILFSSILPEMPFNRDPRRSNFSKSLVIPIGKSGANTKEIELDSEGSSHAIICGTTGSGKSSLINTIILAASSLYSPDELEIHLIDINKSEFNIFAEYNLPHLKTLVTQDNIVGANEVLDYLTAEMQRRLNLIGSKSDIVAYNASVENAKKLPRSLIIIDEYQVLVEDDRAREKMNRLAEMSRAAGMCLIFSSQMVPTFFHSSVSLFGHKFEFKSDKAGDLIPSVSSRKEELETQKGLCFYGVNDNVTLIRIAFAGKDVELGGQINAIVRKFPDHKMIIRNTLTRRDISDPSEIPYISPRARKMYEDDGVCCVRLGLKCLSNQPLEYQFSYKNNVLCICGEYLLTKHIEVSIIKDFLYLSRDIDCRSVIYVDLNKNPNWRRRENVLKKRRDDWLLNTDGRFGYFAADDFDSALDEMEELVNTREQSDDCLIYPVIAIITCAETIESDSDQSDRLLELLERGKNSNLFFALQFNEFTGNKNDICRKLNEIEDAVIVPDREYEGETYSSTEMRGFLEQTQAAETTAKDLLSAMSRKALNHLQHILCNNNEVTSFVPYNLTEDFFKKLL